MPIDERIFIAHMKGITKYLEDTERTLREIKAATNSMVTLQRDQLDLLRALATHLAPEMKILPLPRG